jgi:hypothetical protein
MPPFKPAKVDGRKIVVVAVTAVVAATGIGTIYLPYFADRDKLRGLNEEADGGLSDRDRREYEQYLQQIQEARGFAVSDQPVKAPTMPAGNSMWSRINSAATPATGNSSDKK